MSVQLFVKKQINIAPKTIPLGDRIQSCTSKELFHFLIYSTWTFILIARVLKVNMRNEDWLTPLQIATASRERLFGYETLCSMMDWNSSSSSMPSNGGLKEKRVRERAEEFKHRPVGKLITNIMKLKFFESLLKWLQRTSTGGLKCLCTLLLGLSWVLPVLPAFHTAALHKTTSPLLYYRADRPQSGGGKKGWRMYEKI